MGNWEGEKFQALQPERKEEIIQLVEAGQRESRAKYAKRQAIKENLKLGRIFLAKHEVPIVQMKLNGYTIMASIMPVETYNTTDGYVRLEYAICSPNDHFSEKIGRGKLGYALSEDGKLLHANEGCPASAKLRILTKIEADGRYPAKLFKNFLV